LKVLRSLPPWLWAPAILLADFITKRIVLGHVPAFETRIHVLGNLARFAYVRNAGSAMGLFPAGRLTLIVVSCLASLLLVVLYLRSDPRQQVRRGALAAILGGALGNLIDRLFYGGLVVDFIDIGIGTHRFYTFNVADMGVTIGGLVLFVHLLREARHGTRQAPEEPGAAAAPQSGTARPPEETRDV
jgi:signal peptidase II